LFNSSYQCKLYDIEHRLVESPPQLVYAYFMHHIIAKLLYNHKERPCSVDLQSYIDEIKLSLTGYVLETELDDSTITKVI